MPSTLENFTLSAVAAPDDFIVGYDTATLNGERRWTVSTIANAVSGVMSPALQNLVNEQTITLSAPTGIVAYYAATSAPTGWIECNGATVPNSGSTANLYAFLQAAGNPFGGAGKIPDLRGRFIRSNGSDGTYSSGAFGEKQADGIISHTHSGTTGDDSPDHTHPISAVTGGNQFYNQGGQYTGTYTSSTGGASTRHQHPFTTSSQSPAGTTETRPANVALLACIKL